MNRNVSRNAPRGGGRGGSRAAVSEGDINKYRNLLIVFLALGVVLIGACAYLGLVMAGVNSVIVVGLAVAGIASMLVARSMGKKFDKARGKA